jgi:glycine/D-amino acid oxidase-like deaminating enzyme
MPHRLSRRQLLATAVAGGVAAASRGSPASSSVRDTRVVAKSWDSIVVGAGVFGAWTAWQLRAAGQRVLLVDAYGPAHARASSGGESRLTRGSYGADELYTRMAYDSLAHWRWLSARAGLPIFHPLGVLFFAASREPYFTQSIEVHRRLNLSTQVLSRAELGQRFPQVDWSGVELGLYEPDFGALMARRAVQTLVSEFVASGGEYRQEAIEAPNTAAASQSIRTRSGATLTADNYVFACGPWLPKLFPELLGGRIFPTRQTVFFFATPSGDGRFAPGALPGWADFNHGDIYYGFPDLEARGFKIAHDQHGPPIDPDVGDRATTAAELADVRGYLARRFPALAAQPMIESRVCQYENSSSGDFLIDRHPAVPNFWLLGGGSGHGFKHGPAVGAYASALVRGVLPRVEPRFALATKGAVQQRAVH